jgi:hypothetical protein
VEVIRRRVNLVDWFIGLIKLIKLRNLEDQNLPLFSFEMMCLGTFWADLSGEVHQLMNLSTYQLTALPAFEEVLLNSSAW